MAAAAQNKCKLNQAGVNALQNTGRIGCCSSILPIAKAIAFLSTPVYKHRRAVF